MQRLFLPAGQFCGDTARIVGIDHLHLSRVLRARPGEPLLLLDNTGNAFQAVIVTIGKAETVARLEAPFAMPPEPPVHITVAQALGKGDKFEQVIQHGTEAGACAFVPLRAARSVADIAAGKEADRLARWRQIVKGAAEQSGRARLPEVSLPVTLDALLRTLDGDTRALLLHPAENAAAMRTVMTTRPARVLLMVGPEGGWSPAEVSAAQAANGTPVTLGPRILRTEIAALIAISQILYSWET